MPNPTLIQILRSRTQLTDEQILELSDGEGWTIIRELDEEKRKEKDGSSKLEICFTGFNLSRREELELDAMTKGYRIRKTIAKNLNILVLGETPGEAKIEKAELQGVRILQLHEYLKIANDVNATGDFISSNTASLKGVNVAMDPEGSVHKEVASLQLEHQPVAHGSKDVARTPRLKKLVRWVVYFLAWFVLTGIVGQLNAGAGALVLLSPLAWLGFKLMKWAFRDH